MQIRALMVCACLWSCQRTPIDLCPDDPAKTEAGACGCGVADDDANANGAPDCFDGALDACPQDAAKTQPGTCGCGVSDDDTNNNGVPDCIDDRVDLCPDDPAKTQAGACGCGVSDADISGNGIPDCFDPPAPTFFPPTCKAVQDKAIADTGAHPADGTYTLYVGGDVSKPWEAFCHRMNLSSPREFVTVDEQENFSQISNGTFIVESRYRRYRIDPMTLVIDPLDATFATTQGTDNFTPVFPTAAEVVPAGWAEFQPTQAGEGPPALARVSLEGTGLAFAESILANNLATFFCQVSTAAGQEAPDNTDVEVSADLAAFQLSALEPNGAGETTRVVGDCEHFGGSSAPTGGAWPLQYVGSP